MRILSLLVLVVASVLMASGVLWPDAGYRLWIGVVLVIAWLIARNSHVFTTT